MESDNFIDVFDRSLLMTAKRDHRYDNSIFQEVRYLPPRTKGSFFEKITRDILTRLGHQVHKATSTDHDMIVNQHKWEVKGSTLKMNSDEFSFLQIRPKQDYDAMIFVMAYPDQLKIVEMSKSTILANIDQGHFRAQHGGKKADSGTFTYYGNYESLLAIGGRAMTHTVNDPVQ